MTLFGSDFLVTLMGVNICLAYSVYPTALLGRISVAPVAYMAIGAYAAAYFTTRDYPLVWGLAVGVTLSVGLGLGLSGIAGHLRSHFFLASSLGLVLIVQQLAFSLKDVTGGYLGISAPDGVAEPWEVWLLVVICLGGAFSLRHSALDRVWRAVGSDDHIAGALGISTRRTLLVAGTAGAVLATVAGALYGHLIAFFDPNTFGLTLILQLVAAVVIGGVASWYGPLIGAVVITLLPEALRDFGAWRDAVLGCVLIACIHLLPRGLGDWRGIVGLCRGFTQTVHRKVAERGRAGENPVPPARRRSSH